MTASTLYDLSKVWGLGRLRVQSGGSRMAVVGWQCRVGSLGFARPQVRFGSPL